jgi:hypothetical protein
VPRITSSGRSQRLPVAGEIIRAGELPSFAELYGVGRGATDSWGAAGQLVDLADRISERADSLVSVFTTINEKQYEALKDKGMSKQRAARIANSPGSTSRGDKKSGSGSSSSQGGTTAQKKAAGRKGGKAAARKRG